MLPATGSIATDAATRVTRMALMILMAPIGLYDLSRTPLSLKINGAKAKVELLVKQRWVRFPRQFGGLAKVDSGFDYAASFSACSSIA